MFIVINNPWASFVKPVSFPIISVTRIHPVKQRKHSLRFMISSCIHWLLLVHSFTFYFFTRDQELLQHIQPKVKIKIKLSFFWCYSSFSFPLSERTVFVPRTKSFLMRMFCFKYETWHLSLISELQNWIFQKEFAGLAVEQT